MLSTSIIRLSLSPLPPSLFLLPLCEYGNVQPTLFVNLLLRDTPNIIYPTALDQRRLVNLSRCPFQVAQISNVSLHQDDTPPPRTHPPFFVFAVALSVFGRGRRQKTLPFTCWYCTPPNPPSTSFFRTLLPLRSDYGEPIAYV